MRRRLRYLGIPSMMITVLTEYCTINVEAMVGKRVENDGRYGIESQVVVVIDTVRQVEKSLRLAKKVTPELGTKWDVFPTPRRFLQSEEDRSREVEGPQIRHEI